ncbi:MAG: molecular chaperone DnaJ [Ilumatobacteraceae bacterium]|nr:molecular chaperone DnaJ [Acidimicrobiaceae bacterium]MCO5330800.1 molecular chaperone DnaJ [Ilumatobacteraceae bacterium]
MTAQREWFEKDYYKVLGVGEKATPKEITKAYRAAARDSHPDTHPGDAKAEERFKEVSAAYDVLGDEAKRKEYDEVRALGPMGGGFGPGGPGAGGFNFNVGADGLGDLLGQMFNRGGRGGRGRGASAGAGPQRGADVEATLTLDFVDAAKGLTTTLSLTSDAPCSTCHGSGARPGTQPTVCSQCGGRGVIDDNQGFFSFSSPCRACAGRGVTIEQPCGTCRGTGVEHRPRDVQARIPAGVADGQKIRLKGRGAPGRNGGPAGDLIVECHVAPHPLFGRDGHNLTVRVPVTFAEAALGGDIDVPTLDGPRVMLRLRPGTQSGSRHRVKGKGIVTAKHTGDLIVTVDVDVPHHLTPEQKAAVDAFAEATTVSPRAHLKGA